MTKVLSNHFIFTQKKTNSGKTQTDQINYDQTKALMNSRLISQKRLLWLSWPQVNIKAIILVHFYFKWFQ